MKRLLFLLTVLLLVVTGCGNASISTLTPAGDVAKDQYEIMLITAGIMLLVMIVVMAIFFIVIIRFRRKKGDQSIPVQVEGNHKLEIIWTVIPILLLIVIAIPTVIYTYKLAETAPAKTMKGDAIVINVRSNQYWWEFEYPKDGIVVGQELVVPTDEKIYFNLQSSDVKHSFWIPAAGGKIDTNPDNINEFYLEFDADKAAEAGNLFSGKCAELCGPSHALMDFKVRAIPRAEYDKWVASMKATEKRAAASAAEPDGEATPVATNGDADEMVAMGKATFEQSCISCHAVSAVDKRPAAARLAPNLANFGDRTKVAGVLDNTAVNVEKWLKDPESVKAGNKMTGKYGDLSDEEIQAVAAYLQSLKAE